MKRRRIYLALIISINLMGCNNFNNLKFTEVQYPYRVVENTSITDVGYIDTSLLDEYTFKIGYNTYTLNSDKTEISQIELPKLTDNTKENFGDNIISIENLQKWQANENIDYEKYKDSLETASVYINTIKNIQNITSNINGKDYKVLDDTVYFNGIECKVIEYRDASDTGKSICKALGCEVTEITKDDPVYITYYVDENHNIMYIGADASRAISKAMDKEMHNMILEIYKDIDKEGDRLE